MKLLCPMVILVGFKTILSSCKLTSSKVGHNFCWFFMRVVNVWEALSQKLMWRVIEDTWCLRVSLADSDGQNSDSDAEVTQEDIKFISWWIARKKVYSVSPRTDTILTPSQGDLPGELFPGPQKGGFGCILLPCPRRSLVFSVSLWSLTSETPSLD